MKNSKKIILIAGDPNSVNSEIILKSWKKLDKNLKKKIFLVGNHSLLKRQLNLLNSNIVTKEVKDINENFKTNCLKIININLNFKNPFKVAKKNASQYVLKSLTLAHNLAIKNEVSGIINCPISKQLLLKKNIGVTNFFSKKCKILRNS